jgi:hypothetical protein
MTVYLVHWNRLNRPRISVPCYSGAVPSVHDVLDIYSSTFLVQWWRVYDRVHCNTCINSMWDYFMLVSMLTLCGKCSYVFVFVWTLYGMSSHRCHSDHHKYLIMPLERRMQLFHSIGTCKPALPVTESCIAKDINSGLVSICQFFQWPSITTIATRGSLNLYSCLKLCW